MSAVSNKVMPRSIALWITFREDSRSMRWPKLLQPRPTAETRRPEPPRLRICMNQSCKVGSARGEHIVTVVEGAKKGDYRRWVRGDRRLPIALWRQVGAPSQAAKSRVFELIAPTPANAGRVATLHRWRRARAIPLGHRDTTATNRR